MPEKILIVDDDIDTLRLVRLMLERQGFEVVEASNGRLALDIAQRETPDLILLDIMMPDLDGFEVTRQLRDDTHTGEIPIIMFTAKTQVDDKLMGFEVGADDYITKPTQPRELFAHIKAVLSRTMKTRELTPISDKGYLIGMLAAKGGLGITTLTINLGIAIHNLTEKEVIVAEFRPGQGSLSLQLGYLKPEGLTRLVERKTANLLPRDVESQLVTHSSGVRILMSSYKPVNAKLINEAKAFENITNNLAFMGRYVLLDLGASLSPMAERVLAHCDEVVIATEPTPNTVIQTKEMINDVLNLGVGEGRMKLVLVNRVRSSMQLSWTQVQEELEQRIATVFTPAPELAYQANSNNIPMIILQPNSVTAEQFYKLATEITQHGH